MIDRVMSLTTVNSEDFMYYNEPLPCAIISSTVWADSVVLTFLRLREDTINIVYYSDAQTFQSPYPLDIEAVISTQRSYITDLAVMQHAYNKIHNFLDP